MDDKKILSYNYFEHSVPLRDYSDLSSLSSTGNTPFEAVDDTPAVTPRQGEEKEMGYAPIAPLISSFTITEGCVIGMLTSLSFYFIPLNLLLFYFILSHLISSTLI